MIFGGFFGRKTGVGKLTCGVWANQARKKHAKTRKNAQKVVRNE